jgi:hypothetical protein
LQFPLLPVFLPEPIALPLIDNLSVKLLLISLVPPTPASALVPAKDDALPSLPTPLTLTAAPPAPIVTVTPVDGVTVNN